MAFIYVKTLFPVVCIIAGLQLTFAQIPNFGRCPNYDPITNFDTERFLGKWYEAERYFTVTELASRCIAANYERRSDGNVYVNNEITNRFTGVQRIITGTMKLTDKTNVGKYSVRYSSPVTYDTTLNVLGTDYDSYAVVWSCSGIAGPVGHTESAWVMTRERIPSGPILQRAYGVLDKYKISRTFFVKTDQTDCETLAPAEEVDDTSNNSGYDIVVDDQAVAQEYENDEVQPDNGYYKKNPGLKNSGATEKKKNDESKPESKEKPSSSTSAPTDDAPKNEKVSESKN